MQLLKSKLSLLDTIYSEVKPGPNDLVTWNLIWFFQCSFKLSQLLWNMFTELAVQGRCRTSSCRYTTTYRWTLIERPYRLGICPCDILITILLHHLFVFRVWIRLLQSPTWGSICSCFTHVRQIASLCDCNVHSTCIWNIIYAYCWICSGMHALAETTAIWHTVIRYLWSCSLCIFLLVL